VKLSILIGLRGDNSYMITFLVQGGVGAWSAEVRLLASQWPP
jgi:hypothetical protein